MLRAAILLMQAGQVVQVCDATKPGWVLLTGPPISEHITRMHLVDDEFFFHSG